MWASTSSSSYIWFRAGFWIDWGRLEVTEWKVSCFLACPYSYPTSFIFRNLNHNLKTNHHPSIRTCYFEKNMEDTPGSFWLLVLVKQRVMGSLLVFRENWIFTSKIVSCVCVCSLDNRLMKNVVIFLSGNFIVVLILKRATFYLLSTFYSPMKRHKSFFFFEAHISLTYIIFCSPYYLFCLTKLQKQHIYHVWLFYGVTLGVDSHLCHFGAINSPYT